MPVAHTRPASFVAILAAALAFPGLARAQVPEGFAVVCTYTARFAAGTPGLFLVPLAGGPITPVTGLPPELSTNGASAFAQGGNSVSIRSADGAVIVTTASSTNSPTAGTSFLFVLHLLGAAVDPTRTLRIPLGTASQAPGAPPNSAIAWNLVLPDGRILVGAGDSTGPLSTGPMANTLLAIIDPANPTPLPLLPNPPVGGLFGGFALSPSADYLYYLFSDPDTATADLHRYDLSTAQNCLIATWTSQYACGVCCDDDGTVYVSATDPTAGMHFIHTVQPNGCNPATWTTVQSSMTPRAWGLDLDRASGRFAAISNVHAPRQSPSPELNALSLIDKVANGTGTATVTVIASGGANGWGALGNCGVAVNNIIESYGTPTIGQPGCAHWFENFPNPGGQPTLGNNTFSLTMRATAPALSALLLSFGRGSTSIGGVRILVDLSTVVMQFVTAGPALSVLCPMPIPNTPALSGMVVTAQSLHLETNHALAASRGLTFTVQ